MDPIALDIGLRGATSGMGLILVVSVWTSRIARDAQIAFTFLMATIFIRAWTTLPQSIGLSDQLVQTFQMIGASGTFAVTWFMLVIFLDDRRFSWVWLGSGLLISVWVAFSRFVPDSVPFLRGYALLHFLGLLVMVLYSGKGDLQDARRRIRPAMSSFLLIYCVGLSLTSQPMQATRTIEAALYQSGALLFFQSLFTLWALKANLGNWPGVTTPRLASEPTLDERSSEQNILVKRILKAMEEGVWQTEGLTVSALAQKVKAPEHQVRKAINQVLGHRNFASFINRARIDAAQAQLSDLETSDKSILQIAYDVGFSSLGPFNRAFREATGTSPTDFRKAALQQSAA